MKTIFRFFYAWVFVVCLLAGVAVVTAARFVFSMIAPSETAVSEQLVQPLNVDFPPEPSLVDDVPIAGIARLTASGALDLTFSPIGGADDTVYALALQSDGRIILGGGFSTYDGEPRRGIVRVNSDGSLDNTFNPGTGVDGLVYSIDLQSNGQPLIAGDFSTTGGNFVGGCAAKRGRAVGL